MLKTEAIKLLGGTPTAAASAIGISSQAVSQWPEVLPRRIEDRVQAALARLASSRRPVKPGRRATPTPTEGVAHG